jgi:Xaa-Pro dipeptidase
MDTERVGTDLRAAVLESFPTQARGARVQALMSERGLDCLVAVGKPYATWLTGYSRYFAGISATLIGADGNVELVTSPDEAPVAEKASTASRVHTYGSGGFGLDLDPFSSLVNDLGRVQMIRAAKRLGVAGIPESAGVDLGREPSARLDAELAALMSVKDRDEAEKVAHSYNLCLRAQTAVAEGVNEGASELELFTRAHSTAQLAFGAPVEFISDLLAGPNSADVCCPIAVAGPRRAEPGEPVVADIAVGAGGYWGDTCRTHLRGENEQLEASLSRLAGILGSTVDQMRPGISGRELHARMSEALRDGFPGSAEFPHHGGHGIGLGPCDSPHVIPADDTELEAGMILAIEPGAYFPGSFGIRLENEYLVTAAGGVELNTALAVAGSAT